MRENCTVSMHGFSGKIYGIQKFAENDHNITRPESLYSRNFSNCCSRVGWNSITSSVSLKHIAYSAELGLCRALDVVKQQHLNVYWIQRS